MRRIVEVEPGEVYERWTVLREVEPIPRGHGRRCWRRVLCSCRCGREGTVYLHSLRGGQTKSCGCLRAERVAEAKGVPGRSGGDTGPHGISSASPEYRAWAAMRQRCFNPNYPGYPNYGGRGITVCEEWRNDFGAFFAHVGPRPGPEYSLDRYPDNDGPYEPGNVRWATVKEQARNRRSTIRLRLGELSETLADWADLAGIDYRLVKFRLKCGWRLGDALYTPVGSRRAA